MRPGEFSTYQFFGDGPNALNERVREFVCAEEAVDAAIFYTTNVSAKIGMTKRVIITDGGDCVVWEWQYGKGVIFPPDFEKVIKMERKDESTAREA